MLCESKTSKIANQQTEKTASQSKTRQMDITFIYCRANSKIHHRFEQSQIDL
jgi:hypothetical protein